MNAFWMSLEMQVEEAQKRLNKWNDGNKAPLLSAQEWNKSSLLPNQEWDMDMSCTDAAPRQAQLTETEFDAK